ncbi:MAG: fumarylacetoacetase [Sporichthyaceae bacterium]
MTQDFGSYTLPYGVFSPDGQSPRVGVAVGTDVLDLAAALGDETFARASLNPFLAQGRARWSQVRQQIGDLICAGPAPEHLYSIDAVRLALAFEVADYVDFYSSRQHAENVGAIFRPGADPLPPNWLTQPLGYHGRSGTVVVSGTPIRRPSGLRKMPDGSVTYGPCQALDIEAELGFVVGTPSALGSAVPTTAFREHVFGMVLLNDWSARDIQFWETTPLGPFLGKSFATSISPWVVPLDALADAWLPTPAQEPRPAEYLRDEGEHGLDLALEIDWNDTVISRPPARTTYWTAAQQLAHLTVNGASLRTGDLYGSGTVSGPERRQRGCLLELTWAGRDALTLADGSAVTYLRDGDILTIRATAPGPDGSSLYLGEVTGPVLPA